MKAPVLRRHRESAWCAWQLGEYGSIRPMDSIDERFVVHGEWSPSTEAWGSRLFAIAVAIADAELARDVRALRRLFCAGQPEQLQIAEIADVTYEEAHALSRTPVPTDADLAALLLSGSEWRES